MTNQNELLIEIHNLGSALAVILDQIDGDRPTAMIAAVFDGRELERGRELVASYFKNHRGKADDWPGLDTT